MIKREKIQFNLKKYIEKSSVQNKRIRRIVLKRVIKSGNWYVYWNNKYYKIPKEFDNIIKLIEIDYPRFRRYDTINAIISYFVSNKYEKNLEKYGPLIFRRVKLTTNRIYYKRDDEHDWPCNSWIQIQHISLPADTYFPKYLYILTDIRFVVSHRNPIEK